MAMTVNVERRLSINIFNEFMKKVRRLSRSDVHPLPLAEFTKQNVIMPPRVLFLLPKEYEARCRRPIHSGKSNAGQFYALMQPVVLIGNLCGLIPLQSFYSKDPSRIKYTRRSVSYVCSIIVQFIQLILFVTSFYKQITSGVEFNKIVNLLHYGLGVAIYFNFMLLAARWKELVYCWESNEWLLLREIHSGYDPFWLRQRAWIMLASFTLLGFLIQIFFRISGYQKSKRCTNFQNHLEAFFNLSFPELFQIFFYNATFGFIAIIVSILGEFARVFTDIFLICIFSAMREQFLILNQRILRTPVNEQVMNEKYWQHKWNLYKRIVSLVHFTNRRIDLFILISYASNLYFICVQILYCLKKNSSPFQDIYAWLSLFDLVARTLYMSITAASVHEEAQRLVPFLRTLPTDMMNIEVERFMEQLTSEKVAVTGMEFFSLTKSLILKMVGTIVTYELVLLRFKEQDDLQKLNRMPCS